MILEGYTDNEDDKCYLKANKIWICLLSRFPERERERISVRLPERERERRLHNVRVR
uniref:Uncharacterized protein n=1 Tax=Rhizophora mucronata TaxID=61149 RepID=A0A2P2Q480_RHIMU